MTLNTQYIRAKIRTDNGEFIDKGNYWVDPTHSDFEGGCLGDAVASAKNFLAIKKAIQFAIDNSVKRIKFPAGDFRFVLAQDDAAFIRDSSMIIEGSGIDVTFLKYDSTSISGTAMIEFRDYRTWSASEEPLIWEIKDLTIHSTSALACGRAVNVDVADSGTDANKRKHAPTLRLTRVNIDGKFVRGLDTVVCAHNIEMDKCRIHIDAAHPVGAIIALVRTDSDATGATTQRWFKATNCVFGLATTTDQTDHAMYLNSGLNVHIEGCRFTDAPGQNALEASGSSVTTPTSWKVINCVFEANVKNPIYPGPNATIAEIRGNTFNGGLGGSAVNLVGPGAKIEGNVFNSSGVSVGQCAPTTSHRVVIRGNEFYDCGVTGMKGNGTHYIVTDNSFQIVSAGTIILGTDSDGVGGSAGPLVLVRDNDFLSLVPSGSGPYMIRGQDGKWQLRNNALRGYFASNHAIYIENTDRLTEVTIDGLDVSMDSTNHKLLSVVAAGSNNKIVRARGVRSNSQEVTCPALHYMYFELASGLAVDALASATTVALDISYDTYHVTGVAAIETLSLFGGVPRAHAGVVRLIADGTWSTANTGNIAPKTTGARTVNDVVELTHDPVTNKWYEN